MKAKALLCLLFVFLFSLPSYTQEDCDLAALSLDYAAQLEAAATWEDWQAITANMQAESRRCTVPSDETLGMSRSAPVPLNEGFSYSIGTATVTSVELLTESPDIYNTIPEGSKLLRIGLSFLCAQEDEDETCLGRDIVGGAKLVTDGGEIIDPAPVCCEDNAANWEAYAGVTLTGALYFMVPDGTELGSLRLRPADLDFTDVFFALE